MSEFVAFTVTDSLSGISCLFQAYKVAVVTPVSLETTLAEVSRHESSTAAVILSLYEQKAFTNWEKGIDEQGKAILHI